MGEVLNSFHSQNDYLVFFTEFPANRFTVKTGGAEIMALTKVHPGGGGAPVNVEGPREVEDISLEKPFERALDIPLLARLKLYMRGAKLRLQLTVLPINSAGIPSGAPMLYLRCSVTRVELPDVQKGSADPGMLRITISPEDTL